MLLGFSLPLLLRSPFKMPMPERLFRAVWLGPFGRGMFAVAGFGKVKAPGNTLGFATAATRPTPVTQPPTSAPPVTLPPVEAHHDIGLETRVAELERWRQTVEAREGVDYGTP
jgi:hypothetical protein